LSLHARSLPPEIDLLNGSRALSRPPADAAERDGRQRRIRLCPMG
jgi:hypothetical protein